MSSPNPVPPALPYRRRSLAGPLVLILVGLIFLLANMHAITWARLAFLFANYWPALLIVWGVVKLAEHMQARSQGYPAPGIGAGGVVFIVFLIIFGMAATEAARVNWHEFGNAVDVDDSDLANLFGSSYNYTDQLEQPYTAGTAIQIVSDRGDVSVNAWDEQKIRVVVHKKVVAGSEGEAQKINQETKPLLNTAAGTLSINANTTGAGARVGILNPRMVSSDLEIYVPRAAAVDVSVRRGDVVVRGRDAGVKAATTHGDITVEDVKGDANIQLRSGSVRADQVTGDVTVAADRIADTTLSNIGGGAHLNGEFTGSMKLSKIAKGVQFTSSRTDMRFARLDGELTMDLGELRANALAGPFTIVTHSKDIHLDDVSGDVKVENSNGEIEVQAAAKAPLGAIDIQNRKGEVRVTVPAKSSFSLEARTRRGEIESDFSELKVESPTRGESTASGAVGSGGPHLQISNEYGGIAIRKTG